MNDFSTTSHFARHTELHLLVFNTINHVLEYDDFPSREMMIATNTLLEYELMMLMKMKSESEL
jgi:hypothetical protein